MQRKCLTTGQQKRRKTVERTEADDPAFIQKKKEQFKTE
ncbi:hypothetical protein NC99_10550 [Sunxiuqinia dokdonensis]|uniref:Uncharacterized protein n=1 Tax=Sunxiuqinia dokdonensis TaxID=1409788 RepID=A0A0L8VCT6_9BACT|nr:hypothetical protein NC99_10550 [Sunxiuqinia dokdonensis]